MGDTVRTMEHIQASLSPGYRALTRAYMGAARPELCHHVQFFVNTESHLSSLTGFAESA